jgi:dihydrofolate synthase/folylpolyglutamate synthase
MPQITNFEEAHAALRQFYRKDTTYTLDRMRELMDYLGNPQNELKVIHVAGTSGKTSTAYYAAALLQAAGFKVGLTVSPHVDEVNERVQIGLTPLPEAGFCTALGEFIGKVEKSGILPSYFELMVAFAYHEFARQKVDYAVVEVGLGGLLDGTNVISREDKICIITDIGLDHTEILGDTLGKIAAQKAGIIQPHNHVFVYEQSEEVMAVIAAAADKQSAHVHVQKLEVTPEAHDLPGFQQRNFGLSKAAVQYVLERDGHAGLTAPQLVAAARTHISARMETLKYGGKTIIIDGAHNAQKLETLLTAVAEKYPNQKIAALAGFVEGDTFRLEHALAELLPRVELLIATSFYSEKDYPKYSVAPSIIAAKSRRKGYKNVEVCENSAEALELLLARSEPVLLVTGSFYLLNHIRPLLLDQA